MQNCLFGDGIHDDTAAIQELLDSSAEVSLPQPSGCYLISKPLILHSGNRLSLPRFAEIKLAAQSNCYMLKNETVDDCKKRTEIEAFSFVNFYSPNFTCENIEVSGGIWNFNNKEQNENPQMTKKYEPAGYTGYGFLFYNVRNLKLSSLTLKDPVTFAVMLDTVSHFSVEDIEFDYNDGNPCQANMDGIHLCGNCHHGRLQNLCGRCYDDVVALNAEEGSCGHISDISISGIHTDKSYSAVRLLSARPQAAVKNVHISDIHGTFYHFCIALMKNYKTEFRGSFQNIEIENVYASKCSKGHVNHPWVHNYPHYALIDISSELDIENLKISNLFRDEDFDPLAATILADKGTKIKNFVFDNINSLNKKGGEIKHIEIYATMKE